MNEMDSYRSHMSEDSEKETVWRHGAPPSYDVVNNTFVNGRTKEWPEGSLEETVQNLVKTWEMEVSHKPRIQDIKTIDPTKFSFSVNGNAPLPAEAFLKLGSYNALLASAVGYEASSESFESSHEIFRSVFKEGFAWEVLEVFTPPPNVVFKWRHWGTMDGSYKGHHATGKVIDMLGIAIAKINENMRIVSLEVFYDPSQFISELRGCPFAKSIDDDKNN